MAADAVPRETPLAIVGAGPGGLAAAAQAVALGLPVTLIDENPLAGGQYFRQSPAGFRARPGADPRLARPEAASLLEVVSAPGVTFLPRTTVWGIFDERTLALEGPSGGPPGPALLRAGAVVLASGAYERAFPFPGWTLPGVFTAGGLQVLAKSQGILPGRRVLLAGNGPFLLVVAAHLLEAGADVVAVVEASPTTRSWAALAGLFGHWDVVREGLGHLRRLERANVPILNAHGIVTADGAGEIQRVSVAPVGRGGCPDRTALRSFAVDAVGLGYGFVPSTELLRQAGGQVRYTEDLGGWVPVRSEIMESSVSGLFVAGDGAGIAGARVAIVQGRLAAIGAARALGVLPAKRATKLTRPLVRKLGSLERLRAALNRLYRSDLLPTACLTPDTLVCRCEAVAAEGVEEAIRDGARSLHEVKIYTRAGMGLCQGRVCGPLVAALLAERAGVPPDSVLPGSVRPPVKPIRLGSLAAADPEPAT